MPMRKNEGPRPQVTVRFADGMVRFPISAGDTLGNLASRLDRLWHVQANPLSIVLTFPAATKRVLH